MNLLLNRCRFGLLALGVSASALLASCGGGDAVVAFDPTRVVSFGDENSLLTKEGGKYTVNNVVTTNGVTTLDCGTYPLWVQALATNWGMAFPQCNTSGAANPASRILAAPGAKVADLVAQLDAFLAGNTLSQHDLVTMFVGQNDILELYAAYPAATQDSLTAEARSRGGKLAAQVQRAAAAGGKILVLTTLDLGRTPFAANENTKTGDGGRSTFLSALSTAFNDGLKTGLGSTGGHQMALYKADETVSDMINNPGSYNSMTDVANPVCDPALAPTVDQCTIQTVTPVGADPLKYLWADMLHLSPNGHTYVGNGAISQVKKNPF